MKVELVNEEVEPAFKPITMKITIETPEQAAALWARLNVSWQDVKSAAPNGGLDTSDDTDELFHTLETALSSRGVTFTSGGNHD